MPEVRWAHRGDAPAVYPLFRALLQAEGAAPPGPGEFSRLWQASFRDAHPFRFAVAEERGRGILGCLTLHAHFSTWKGAPVVSLEDFFVLEGERGKGIGKAMLAFAEAYARSLGAARVELHVRQDNPRARALYEREGYAPTPYAWMHKPLPPREGAVQGAPAAPGEGSAGGAGEGEVAEGAPPARRQEARRPARGPRRHRSGAPPRRQGRGRGRR